MYCDPGSGQKVSVENIERLGLANYQTGYFDKIYSGCVGLATIRHDVEILGRLTRLLKPGGHLSYVESLETGADPATLSSALILAGLSATSQPTVLQSFPSLEATLAKLKLTEASLYVVTAKKPNHEVGASRLLSFAKPAAVPAPAPRQCLDPGRPGGRLGGVAGREDSPLGGGSCEAGPNQSQGETIEKLRYLEVIPTLLLFRSVELQGRERLARIVPVASERSWMPEMK